MDYKCKYNKKSGAWESVVTFPVFNGYAVEVYITSDPNKTISYLGYEDDAEVFGFWYGMCYQELNCSKLIIKLDSGYDVAVHECVHAIDNLFASVGMTIDPKDDEAYAYHLGYLSGIIINLMDFIKDNYGNSGGSSEKSEAGIS